MAATTRPIQNETSMKILTKNMIYDKPLRTRYFKTGTSLPEILRKNVCKYKHLTYRTLHQTNG